MAKLRLQSVIPILGLLCACGHEAATYTSQDLALLPCESTGRVFFPVEFDKEGRRVYKNQWEDLKEVITERKVRDVFIFVHGWDKTASLAEKDYQDFICRFYARANGGKKLNLVSGVEGKGSSIFIGLFWPSTIFANSSDLGIIKPATYYTIRRRADTLATSGFQEVMGLLQEMLLKDETLRGTRFHFIGHSFGGRVIVKGFLTFFEKTITSSDSWLFFAEKVNLVLLLPAVSRDALSNVNLLFDAKGRSKKRDNVGIQELTNSYKSKKTA